MQQMIKKHTQIVLASSLFIFSSTAALAESENLYSFISNPKYIVGKQSKSLILFLEKTCLSSKNSETRLRGNYTNIYECKLNDKNIKIGINIQKPSNTTEYFALLAPEESYLTLFKNIQKNNGKGYKIDDSRGSQKINGWTIPISKKENVSLEIEIIKRDKKTLLQAHLEGNEEP